MDECGTSIPKLSATLQLLQSDAVVVEEDGAALGNEVLAAARSLSSAPFILFQGDGQMYDASQFDLVIPPRSPSKDWLNRSMS